MPTQKCSRCHKRKKPIDLIDWLEDSGELSPKFCRVCYEYILNHWTEGCDIENIDDD